ncbi:MAG: SAM-dependent methyltransferase, partial [Micromonosporaceae bacterium]|nr:SAM-dependent methyltransferase [Micromonosporaceae bacterium]
RKRGVAVDPDRLRRELRLSGHESATLVLTRLGTRPTALLCQRLPTGPS